MKKILIIEDDPAVIEGLKESLRNEHFDVAAAYSGEQGYQLVKAENPDLILLDLMLPDIDGMDICRRLRADNIFTPIIMLTGKKDEIDKILGLEIGADDYITKPFSWRELAAKIKVILRRIDEYKSESIENFTFADVVVDFKKMEVTKNGKIYRLTVTELNVLKYLIERKGEVVSRDDLLNNVWGYDKNPVTRTVDNYILSLRKKTEDDHHNPKHFIKVPKVGYKFVEETSQ